MYVYGGKWRAGANLVGVFTDVSFIHLLRAKDGVPSAVGRGLENHMRNIITYYLRYFI